MAAGTRVLGGMPVRRGVAAPHVSAAATDAKVDPPAADSQAILASLHALGNLDLDRVQVPAGGFHQLSDNRVVKWGRLVSDSLSGVADRLRQKAKGNRTDG